MAGSDYFKGTGVRQEYTKQQVMQILGVVVAAFDTWVMPMTTPAAPPPSRPAANAAAAMRFLIMKAPFDPSGRGGRNLHRGPLSLDAAPPNL